MYGIDITLTTGKTITVHGLTEIRVQDEHEHLDPIKPEQFFDFFWLAVRRYSFIGKRQTCIVDGKMISYVNFFLEC